MNKSSDIQPKNIIITVGIVLILLCAFVKISIISVILAGFVGFGTNYLYNTFE